MSALKLSISADKIATVTFDSPPNNLFNYSVYNEFKAMFDDLSEREDVSVVILNAAGKNFSFGNKVEDLQTVKASYADEHYRIVGEGLAAIYACKKPTIAAVQGYAVGAGLAAPAACDIIIASEDAMFSIPEITVGIVGASAFLEQLVPKKIARYYTYTGKAIPAYKIYQWGGLLELVPKSELNKTALRIAHELLERTSPLGLSLFKQAMNENDNDRLLEKFYTEKKYGRQFMLSEDFKESTAAFIEKRKPVYTGK